ncbi:MAG: dTDP-glucose 4,6-dehydratase [Syntrophomonadaceae bacterium]|nr:dTDP-glucose 4,6-dehydratase [Syntrophomonadaceae bacterium]
MNNKKQQHTVLITGGAGFIGSNFIPYFIDKYPDYLVINLDNLSYAGDLNNLDEVAGHPNHKFIRGNITNRELLDHLFSEYDIKGVIHFAAESHVDNSIESPGVFFDTNIHGTYTLIDVARERWMDAPHVNKPGYEKCRFHHISTDEVYGSLGSDGLFTEETPYAPNSPYSASKASADMIVRSYHHTYGMNTVITNSSNNYGPRQHSEKLIPTIIRKALNGQPIPIYGDGKNVRDWLYVEDHCRAIDLVFHEGKAGESYNIGANNEQTNLSMAFKICEILDDLAGDRKQELKLDSFKDLITFVKDRPGHDQRYALDNAKLIKTLGWKAETSLLYGLFKTVNWYINHENERECNPILL